MQYHRAVTAGSIIQNIQQKWLTGADGGLHPRFRIARIIAASVGLWSAGAICRWLDWNRTTTALLLLLAVIGLATFRDRLLTFLRRDYGGLRCQDYGGQDYGASLLNPRGYGDSPA